MSSLVTSLNQKSLTQKKKWPCLEVDELHLTQKGQGLLRDGSLTYQPRFIPESSTIQCEAISPLPTASLSCFQKLKTKSINKFQIQNLLRFMRYNTFIGSLYLGKRVTLEQDLQLQLLEMMPK